MVDPYAERVFYLQARPQDCDTILALTGPAIKILDRLVDAPTRSTVLPADEKVVKDFILQHASE